MTLTELGQELSTLTVLQTRLESTLSKQQAQLEEQEALIETYRQAILLCDKCIDEQADLVSYLVDVVNAFLTALFPNKDLEFAFVNKVSTDGNLLGLQPIYVVEGEEMEIKSEGAGVRNVTSIAIRFALLAFLFKKYNIEKFLFIDEQLLNLDTKRWDELIKLLDKFLLGIDAQLIAILQKDDVDFPNEVALYISGKSTKVINK